MLLICAIIKAIKIAAGVAKKIGVIKHILGLYNEQSAWLVLCNLGKQSWRGAIPLGSFVVPGLYCVVGSEGRAVRAQEPDPGAALQAGWAGSTVCTPVCLTAPLPASEPWGRDRHGLVMHLNRVQTRCLSGAKLGEWGRWMGDVTSGGCDCSAESLPGELLGYLLVAISRLLAWSIC